MAAAGAESLGVHGVLVDFGKSCVISTPTLGNDGVVGNHQTVGRGALGSSLLAYPTPAPARSEFNKLEPKATYQGL